MQVSVLQENLARALEITRPFTTGKGYLPILKSVRLSTENGMLRLDATDLERWGTTWVGAMVEDEGAICIPHALLADFIGNLNGDRIDITVGEDRVFRINSGSDTGEMTGTDVAEFPPAREVNPQFTATFDAAELAKLIRRTAPFAAAEESRPVLTGVSVNLGPDGYVAASADGFRLSKQTGLLASWAAPEPTETAEGEGEEPLTVDALIPARTLFTVGKMLKGVQDPVKVEIDGSAQIIRFTIRRRDDTIELTSQLLAGTFPNYEQLIPQSVDWSASMAVGDFKRVAKAASAFAKDGSNILRINFEDEEDNRTRLVISGAAEEVGRSWDPVYAQEPFGMDAEERPRIAFNGRYLLDILAACDDTVQMSGTTPSSPGVFRHETDGFTHVVMPMFVQW